MAPIFVGNKAERTAFKNAGGFTSEMRKQKGKAYDITSYAAERSKSNVSVIRSATSGTIKPDFKSGVMKVAGTPSVILGSAAALGSQPAVKGKLETVLGGIPDLPGTWDDKAKQWILDNPTAAGIGAVAAVGAAGAGLYYLGTRKKKSKKKSTKKKSTKKKSRKSRSTTRRRKSAPTRRARRRGYGTEAQYKRKGGKDVKYTKNGQPYVIQSNGRARFIKRSR